MTEVRFQMIEDDKTPKLYHLNSILLLKRLRNIREFT